MSETTEVLHTPEPWGEKGSLRAVRASNHGGYSVKIHARDDRGLATVAKVYGGNYDDAAHAEANARRVFAAVNACAGIPVKALEDGAVTDLLEALRKAAKLLSTAEDCLAQFGEREIAAKMDDGERIALAAIARAEGRATPAPQGATQEGEG